MCGILCADLCKALRFLSKTADVVGQRKEVEVVHRYLSTAMKEVVQVNIVPDVKGSHTFWSTKFVTHYGQHVHPQLLHIHLHLQQMSAVMPMHA